MSRKPLRSAPMFLARLMLFCGLLASSACFSLSLEDKHACSSDRDCLADRVCQQGMCIDRDEADGESPQDSGPGPEIDASATPDTGVEFDAGNDAGNDAATGASPTLVLVGVENGVGSLYAVNADDFTLVHKLDPRVSSTTGTATILGYSPSGTQILVREERPTTPQFYLSRPCRSSSCVNSTDVYQFVLEGQPPAYGPYFDFSSDERSILFRLNERSVLVSPTRSPIGGENGVREVAINAAFIAGGQGLIASVPVPGTNASGGERLRTQLTDLRANSYGVPFFLLDAATDDASDSLHQRAPDGLHFVVSVLVGKTVRHRVFDTLAALDGDREGRLMDGSVVYSANDRVVWYRSGELVMERWDGSNPVSLGAQSQWSNFRTCGNNMIGWTNQYLTAANVVTLPGSEDVASAAITKLDVPYCINNEFSKDCSRVRVLCTSGQGDYLIDFASRNVSKAQSIGSTATGFSDDGAMFVNGTGLGYVYRVTPPEQPVLAFSPVIQKAGVRIVLGRKHPFFLGAGAIEDQYSPTLYRVDMSNTAQPSVERLLDYTITPTRPELSPDDRYAAFMIDANSTLPRAASDRSGLYEIELATKQTRRLAQPWRKPAGGVQRIMQLPGKRDFAVIGRYADNARDSLFTVSLDERLFRAQVAEERAGWPVSDVTPSPDGTMAAVVATSPNGPIIWLQSVPKNGESKIIAEYTSPPRYQGGRIQSYGFAGSLGYLYATEETGPARFNLITGTSTLFLSGFHKPDQFVISAARSRVAFTYESPPGAPAGYHAAFVDGSDPDTAITISSDQQSQPSLQLSPDGRYLLHSSYQVEGNFVIRLYDLDNRVDYPLAPTRRFNYGVFSKDSKRLLLQADDGALSLVSLYSGVPVEERVVPQGPLMSYIDLVSADALRVYLRDGDAKHWLVDLSTGTQFDAKLNDETIDAEWRSPDGAYYVRTVGPEGVSRAYRYDLTRPENAPEELVGYSGGELVFDAKGRHVFAAGGVLVWKTDNLTTRHVIAVPGGVGYGLWVAAGQ